MTKAASGRLEAILDLRARILRNQLPDTHEIRKAHAFAGGDIDVDRRLWCKSTIASGELTAAAKVMIKRVASDGSEEMLLEAYDALVEYPGLRPRLNLYLAAVGNIEAATRELSHALDITNDLERYRAVVLALGFHRYASGPLTLLGITWTMDEAVTSGREQLHGLLKAFFSHELAVEGMRGEPLSETEADRILGEALSQGEPSPPTAPPAKEDAPVRVVMKSRRDGSVRVVPAFSLPTSKDRSDRHRVRGDFHPISGVHLPLVPSGDVAKHLRQLVARSPHLSEVFDTLLRDVARAAYVRFRPTILLGGPGVGKSDAARQFAAAVQAPVTVYSCAGTADGTFAGTAAHWSTSGASVPATFIKDCRHANPIIVLDEIAKTGEGSQNGRLHDALLNFIDRGSAASYRDPSLELPVDLSHVNYIMTANTLAGISAPLLDRCRIIHVPDPRREHIPVLARSIVEAIAIEQALDPRWFPPLAADELENIIEAWDGGSIRRLRVVVEAALEHRDSYRGMM